MNREEAEALYEDDPLRFAAGATDYGWFQLTGMCGGCGGGCACGGCEGTYCPRCPERQAEGSA